MKQYENLIYTIIKNLGGKQNIKNVSHCMTRLRITIGDYEKINEKEIENHKEVVTAQQSGGKYQIVIGTHVNDVYGELMEELGESNMAEPEKVEGSWINRVTAIITQIIAPVLGIMGSAAIIQGVASILLSVGVVGPEDGGYIILNAMGQAGLMFFPVYLGYTSAKVFKLNPFVGLLIGCILMFPNLAADLNAGDPLYTLFEGTFLAQPVHKTFFGIPVLMPVEGYATTVIPIVFSCYFAGKIELFFRKILPKIIQGSVLPLCTVLVAAPIILLGVGPICNILNAIIAAGVTFIFGKSAILASILAAAVYQPLVVLGLHWGLVSVGMANWVQTGQDIVGAIMFPASFAHMVSCLAVYLRTKSVTMKNITLPAFISACFCIIEPSIYGVTLPVKKRFIHCIIGGTIGAVIIAAFNTTHFGITMGVLGFTSFINPATGDMSGVIVGAIAVAVTMIITFCLTYFSYKPGEDGKNDEFPNKIKNISTKKKDTIYSPLNGEVYSISEIKDEAFSHGLLGKGVYIKPTDGQVVAPLDGEVTAIFPTGHAIGITADSGAEVLIHIGTDFSEIEEGLFIKKIEQGTRVKRGEVLVTFDIDNLRSKGYEPDTAVVVTNSDEYLDIILNLNNNMIRCNDILMSVVPKKTNDKAADLITAEQGV